MSEFRDDMTLGEARDLLRTLIEGGHACPCCRQFAKVYRRALPSASARVLIALWRHGAAVDFVHLPPLLETLTGTAAQGGYGTLSIHWQLIERQSGFRDDGSDRVGWWRLTPEGARFVASGGTVAKYARIYNGRCLGLEGPQITVHQALGKRFNYAELMQGV